MTNSEIRSSVKSKIKELYPKLFGYGTIISAITLIVCLPFILGQMKQDMLYSILAFADLFALFLILSPLDYIYKKSGFKISNGEPAEQSNPFKLKIGKGRYFKIVALNLWKAIPGLLMLIHLVLLFPVTLATALSFTSSNSSQDIYIARIIGLIIIFTFPITSVVATIKTFSYSVADYVFIEQADISPLGAIKKSKKLMKHNKMRYFKLCLSYLVWLIIPYVLYDIVYAVCINYNVVSASNPLLLITSTVIAFIPALFISPYLTVATAEFYNELKRTNKE